MSKWVVCVMACAGASVYMYANESCRKLWSLQLQVKENVTVPQVSGYRGHNGGLTTQNVRLSLSFFFKSMYFKNNNTHYAHFDFYLFSFASGRPSYNEMLLD